MTTLGNGLSEADQNEEALSVRETELSWLRRLGLPEEYVLAAQSNLAGTYRQLGRDKEALQLKRDVYSGHLSLDGEEHDSTLIAAYNYALSLVKIDHFEEAKSLLRKTIPVARRVLGESDHLTLSMRSLYAKGLYEDAGATLDDLRESVTLYEDAGATLDDLRESVTKFVDLERIARRVFGGAHPLVGAIAQNLQDARAALRARETP